MRAAVVQAGCEEPHVVIIVGVDVGEFVNAVGVLKAVVVGQRDCCRTNRPGECLLGEASVDVCAHAVVMRPGGGHLAVITGGQAGCHHSGFGIAGDIVGHIVARIGIPIDAHGSGVGERAGVDTGGCGQVLAAHLHGIGECHGTLALVVGQGHGEDGFAIRRHADGFGHCDAVGHLPLRNSHTVHIYRGCGLAGSPRAIGKQDGYLVGERSFQCLTLESGGEVLRLRWHAIAQGGGHPHIDVFIVAGELFHQRGLRGGQVDGVQGRIVAVAHGIIVGVGHRVDAAGIYVFRFQTRFPVLGETSGGHVHLVEDTREVVVTPHPVLVVDGQAGERAGQVAQCGAHARGWIHGAEHIAHVVVADKRAVDYAGVAVADHRTCCGVIVARVDGAQQVARVQVKHIVVGVLG